MFTPRKRHLRKKRHFLHKQHTFAVFNASNLKTSRINDIKLSLGKNKLYSVPLYLKPPKLAIGYPIIMIVYNNLEDLRKDLPKITKEIDYIDICINKEWYSTKFLESSNINNQTKKLLSLILYKNKT